MQRWVVRDQLLGEREADLTIFSTVGSTRFISATTTQEHTGLTSNGGAMADIQYCVFKIDHWSTCMSKGEWSSWVQAIGTIVALAIAIWAASAQIRHARWLLLDAEAGRIEARVEFIRSFQVLCMRLAGLARSGGITPPSKFAGIVTEARLIRDTFAKVEIHAAASRGEAMWLLRARDAMNAVIDVLGEASSWPADDDSVELVKASIGVLRGAIEDLTGLARHVRRGRRAPWKLAMQLRILRWMSRDKGDQA